MYSRKPLFEQLDLLNLKFLDRINDTVHGLVKHPYVMEVVACKMYPMTRIMMYETLFWDG